MIDSWYAELEPGNVTHLQVLLHSANCQHCHSFHRIQVISFFRSGVNNTPVSLRCKAEQLDILFYISNFRCGLHVVFFILCDSLAPEFHTPTFRNTLSVPSS